MMLSKDPKYIKVCELCGAKKTLIYDTYVCLVCHKKYMRHKELYGYAKEKE